MSFLSTYSPRNVIVNYAGTNFNSGRVDDVFVNIAEGSPRISTRKGNSGDTSVALSSDHSAIVTLSFYPESQSGKIMTGLYYGLKNAESVGKVILGSVPLSIIDPSGGVYLTCAEAVLMNKTDTTLGADTGTISFEFYVEQAVQGSLPDEYEADVQSALAYIGVPV